MAIADRKADGLVAPPLKWAGGKRWQVALIRALWEPRRHCRYVEPFCGGLAMALGLRPERAVLNDANPHLINFYRWVQSGFAVRIPLENSAATYYQHRERFNALVAAGEASSQEAAGLFYYLNRTGYNGLCRFNRDGRFNVPFGRYAAIRYQRDFAQYQPVFKNWTFTSGDFETVAVHPEDFVYADPPYDVEFTQYASDAFRWTDQERTAAWLAYRPCPVVLVNQATDRIERLYRQLGFSIAFADGPRRISCSGDRSPAREIIATRNLRSAPAIGGPAAPHSATRTVPHLHVPESHAPRSPRHTGSAAWVSRQPPTCVVTPPFTPAQQIGRVHPP
jgi:DNA adenine methylase